MSEQPKCGDCGRFTADRAHPGAGRCFANTRRSTTDVTACLRVTVDRLRAIIAADADLLEAGERLSELRKQQFSDGYADLCRLAWQAYDAAKERRSKL